MLSKCMGIAHQTLTMPILPYPVWIVRTCVPSVPPNIWEQFSCAKVTFSLWRPKLCVPPTEDAVQMANVPAVIARNRDGKYCVRAQEAAMPMPWTENNIFKLAATANILAKRIAN